MAACTERTLRLAVQTNTQVAVLDNRAATLIRKLVLPFGGVGNRGVSGLRIVSCGADFFGDARRQVFEGTEHTRQGSRLTAARIA